MGRRQLVTLAGWLALAPMFVLALARLARLSDHLGRLFAIESLTLWLFLPAWAVLAAALLTRRRALGAVAAVLVLAHLVWVGPDLRWWPRDDRRGTGPTVRIVSTNVYAYNEAPRRAAAELARLRPDVLVVVELSPVLAAAIDRATGDRLPYRFTDPHAGGDAFGAGIYSRFPLSDETTRDLAGFPLLSATVALPGGSASLFAVHTLQPLAGLDVLRRQLTELDHQAERTKGPVIMAGDFNETRQHRGFRALVSHGLHDAHLERGRGLARTWPMNLPGPAFALLDHVLVSKHFVVRDVDEATIPGSDHRAVVAQLRVSGR